DRQRDFHCFRHHHLHPHRRGARAGHLLAAADRAGLRLDGRGVGG
ncbi:MAG: Isocitrate dehydrogenase [NADP]; Monomeric isocitrate dehydrogenase [NADP], partial [uncultured Friedmanniella sp.]